MARAFRPDPVPVDVVDRCVAAASRAPAAGNTREGRGFGVVTDPSRYWSVTLPDPGAFAFPGLLRAPVLVVVCCAPDAYVARYAEPDKGRGSTLGSSAASWPQPLWWFDAGAAAEALLLQARAEGLGACLFGVFEHEAGVLALLGAPDGWRAACTIALGWPDEGAPDRPGRSAARPATAPVWRVGEERRAGR